MTVHHHDDSGSWMAANMTVMMLTIFVALAVVIGLLFYFEPWAGDDADDGVGVDVNVTDDSGDGGSSSEGSSGSNDSGGSDDQSRIPVEGVVIG